ncbi:MAG: RNA polymerase sigma factor [Kordiimonas sp.]
MCVNGYFSSVVQAEQKVSILNHYSLNREKLRRFLVSRFRDVDFADDVLQETFLKLDSFAFDKPIHNVEGFLFRVANNVALDMRRKFVSDQSRDQKWYETKVVAESSSPTVEDEIDVKKQLEQTIACLQLLSPRSREVFVANRFEGLTYKQVAEKFGLSQSTVEKHMIKAIKHLIDHRGKN